MPSTNPTPKSAMPEKYWDEDYEGKSKGSPDLCEKRKKKRILEYIITKCNIS